jgi:hypothetical protein
VVEIGLWLAQGLLAIGLGAAGAIHAFAPMAELNRGLAWTAAAPAELVRAIGAFEVLAAFGVILPSLTRKWPALTPLAAAVIGAIQVIELLIHAHVGDVASALPTNLGILAAAVFVAWGRGARRAA